MSRDIDITSCPEGSELSAFWDGECPTDQHLRYSRHITDCCACRRQVEELEVISRLLAEQLPL